MTVEDTLKQAIAHLNTVADLLANTYNENRDIKDEEWMRRLRTSRLGIDVAKDLIQGTLKHLPDNGK